MTETLKIIKKFVKNNYGESEVENPSYDLKALANEIDSRYKLKEIQEKLESEFQYWFERNKEEYFLYHEKGGFGEIGCAKNEDVFDEIKAREDFLDNYEWADFSPELIGLITQMLWEL